MLSLNMQYLQFCISGFIRTQRETLLFLCPFYLPVERLTTDPAVRTLKQNCSNQQRTRAQKARGLPRQSPHHDLISRVQEKSCCCHGPHLKRLEGGLFSSRLVTGSHPQRRCPACRPRKSMLVLYVPEVLTGLSYHGPRFRRLSGGFPSTLSRDVPNPSNKSEDFLRKV